MLLPQEYQLEGIPGLDRSIAEASNGFEVCKSNLSIAQNFMKMEKLLEMFGRVIGRSANSRKVSDVKSRVKDSLAPGDPCLNLVKNDRVQ